MGGNRNFSVSNSLDGMELHGQLTTGDAPLNSAHDLECEQRQIKGDFSMLLALGTRTVRVATTALVPSCLTAARCWLTCHFSLSWLFQGQLRSRVEQQKVIKLDDLIARNCEGAFR